ncbi:glycoside hydrolase family 95 protein [Sphingobacterium sp. LRF_L2]|uniref:glycoside hydrolase family 95 protein n=1 Tax=Sphingobacterium sp. LRF_L2 TaxID=3369421 RepID=UPI003F63D84B
MKLRFFVIYFLLCVSLSKGYGQTNNTLWYDKPAKEWVEALPLGNGELGAMIFGGVEDELIQLNESTLWSGGPRKDNVNPQAYSYLKQVRTALQNKDYELAKELTKKMQGHYTESFLPLGDLHIKQLFPSKGKVTSYYRDLDIAHAVAKVRFEQDGNVFTREMFVSGKDKALVIRLSSEKKEQLKLDIKLSSMLRPKFSVEGNAIFVMDSKAPARVDPSYYNKEGRNPVEWEDVTGCNGMRVQSLVKAESKDGNIIVDEEGIHVEGATEVMLYLTAATSFNGFDKCPDKNGKDEKKIAHSYIDAIAGKTYPMLFADHVADFQSFFNRVTLALDEGGQNPVLKNLPSDFRLKLYSYGNQDAELEEFFFQYGRYLLISSSRSSEAPANLQGIWNKEFRAPWSSNYTININTQMNYWPAEPGNLSELHQPLLNFVKNLSSTGRKTAQEYYKTRGWVAHHNTDIWGLSNAVGNLGDGDPSWANWYMGGAWLSQHLWEHYAYTRDLDYLKNEAYPIMKEAALFCVDWLIERDGKLITSPSTTPENLFWYKGKQVTVSEGTTMDIAIIRDLFKHVIEASKILQIDDRFRKLLEVKQAKLWPYGIGAKGQLLEWMEDYEEVDPQHRHLSHLFGLHPGNDISPLRTPALAKAAEKTFELRGDEGTGWSKGWKINFAARLLDGDHAYKMIREILRYCEPNQQGAGGTYPNFFDAHPPFQIDGNFGATAGFMEMLMQSHLDEIHLLPALPTAWNSGKVTGLVARGNFLLDIAWAQGVLKEASLTSRMGSDCKLRTSVPVVISGVKSTETQEGNYFVYSFSTDKGATYSIRRK